ncbi:MAG: hypothetical protein ISS56_11710 [Anaerolineae bacterium]|nr:hypothetical protein [Anaerolineae bacterium]
MARREGEWVLEQEGAMADDVGYVNTGPQGKQCVDCKNYEPSEEDPAVGKCAGFDVQATASCNYFAADDR